MLFSTLALMGLAIATHDIDRPPPPRMSCYETLHRTDECDRDVRLRYRCEFNSRVCSREFDCECIHRECTFDRPHRF